MILGMIIAMAIQATETIAQAPEASERLRLAASEAAAFPNTALYGYVIEARSPRSIRNEMNRLRPSSNGHRHDATTNWRYSVQFQTIAGRCDPSSALVTYSILITLPDLQNPEKLNRRDREAWDQYFAALLTHELNHARIAQHGADIYQTQVRAAANCEDARLAAAAASEAISAASAQYDLQTEHGRREGAVFPR